MFTHGDNSGHINNKMVNKLFVVSKTRHKVPPEKG